MPQAHEIATDLRKIADALDKEPKTVMVQPMLSFYNNTKDQFLDSLRNLPKPFLKEVDDHRYLLQSDHKTSAVWLRTQVDRSKVCTLVKPAQPAVYDCAPLLSEEEEAELV